MRNRDFAARRALIDSLNRENCKMTITEAAKQFAVHQAANGNSSKTIASYQRELRKLSYFLGPKTPIENVDNNQLNEFLTSDICELRPDGGKRTFGSIANTKAVINAFFKWLAANGIRPDNPAITISIPKNHPKTPVYLSGEEVKALLKVIKETRGWQAQRDHAACAAILHTGLRAAELSGLDIDDFDLSGKKLHIKKAKGGQPTVKHINGKLMKILEPFVKDRLRIETDSNALFISQWRRRLDDRQFAIRLRQWAKKAGITKSVTPHTLRHTFATILYAKTKDIIAVQKALGHVYLATTQIYTHIDDQDLQNALEAL